MWKIRKSNKKLTYFQPATQIGVQRGTLTQREDHIKRHHAIYSFVDSASKYQFAEFQEECNLHLLLQLLPSIPASLYKYLWFTLAYVTYCSSWLRIRIRIGRLVGTNLKDLAHKLA